MKWIMIEDKLPIVGEWVLTSNIDDKWVDRGSMDANGKWFNDCYEIIPTHWMPLPEPPKA